jgi:hypothetical protein
MLIFEEYRLAMSKEDNVELACVYRGRNKHFHAGI